MTRDISSNDRGTSATSETQSLERPAWKTWKSDFDAEFRELLDFESSEGRIIFCFIRMRLKQFHLESAHSEASVLTEVYLRAIRKIESGTEIRVPTAWVRKTAHNYIRELNRIRNRWVQLEDSHLDPRVEDKYNSDRSELEEQLNVKRTAMREAFQQLNPDEQQLLQLKIVEGLSWRQIQSHGKYTNCSESALRKRKQRALEKLKQICWFSKTDTI